MTVVDPTRVLERLAAGDALTDDETAELIESRDLIVLGMLGDAVRKRQHGRRVTFVRVVEVPVETGSPPTEDARTCGLWRLTGAPASVETLVAFVRQVARAAGPVPISGFSLEALAALARREGRPLTDLLAALRDAGLRLVADGLIDGAVDPVETFGAARHVGVSVERATVKGLVRDWPATAARLERVADAYGDALRFAPLPRGDAAATATGYDDVRQVALARLLVPSLASIQVDWRLHGPKLAQVALLFGADDIDVVVTPDDATLGPRRGQLVDVHRSIEAAQLEAVERDGREELMTA